MIKLYKDKNKTEIIGSVKGNFLLDNLIAKGESCCEYEYFHEGVVSLLNEKGEKNWALLFYDKVEVNDSYGYIASKEEVIERIIELRRYSLFEKKGFEDLKELFEKKYKKYAL